MIVRRAFTMKKISIQLMITFLSGTTATWSMMKNTDQPEDSTLAKEQLKRSGSEASKEDVNGYKHPKMKSKPVSVLVLVNSTIN